MYSAEECMPFVRCESEDRAFGVLAVPDTNLAAWQVGYLDAVAVRVAEGTLNPVRSWIGPYGTAME